MKLHEKLNSSSLQTKLT